MRSVGSHDSARPVPADTSDNGGVSSGDAFSTSNLPLRGGKGRQWEGGYRVPYFIKAPGIAAPGSRSDVAVSGIDFFPTLLELVGIVHVVVGFRLSSRLKRFRRLLPDEASVAAAYRRVAPAGRPSCDAQCSWRASACAPTCAASARSRRDTFAFAAPPSKL